MRENAVDEITRHLRSGLRVIVERRDGGKDGGSRIGCELHIAQMNAIERCLADAQDEGASLFEADVGCPVNEIGGEPVGDRS